jgi:hypothetical protein
MAPSKGLPAKRAGIRDESRRNGAAQLRDVRRDGRRGAHLHARHSAFVGGRNSISASGVYCPGMGHDAQAIVDQVRALDSDQLLDRYHELVDKRLQGTLDFTELLELERIEARLDTEDENEAARLTILQDDWRRERDELVASIEHLLARFKAAS